MASGGSLKVKLPSFTSTSWLIAQPPASSVNLSSKTTWVPSQAGAGSTKPTQQRSAAATPSPVLAISGFPRLQALMRNPTQKSLSRRPALGNRGAQKEQRARLPSSVAAVLGVPSFCPVVVHDGHHSSPSEPYRP